MHTNVHMHILYKQWELKSVCSTSHGSTAIQLTSKSNGNDRPSILSSCSKYCMCNNITISKESRARPQSSEKHIHIHIHQNNFRSNKYTQSTWQSTSGDYINTNCTASNSFYTAVHWSQHMLRSAHLSQHTQAYEDELLVQAAILHCKLIKLQERQWDSWHTCMVSSHAQHIAAA